MAPELPPADLPPPPEPRLSRWRRRALDLADHLPDSIPALLSWLPLTVLISLAPGASLVPLLARQLGYLQDNRLETPVRATAAAFVLVLATFTAALLRWRVRRRVREGELPEVARASVLRRFSPLLFLPVLVWMIPQGPERSRPLLELALLLAMSAWTGRLVYAGTPRSRELPAFGPLAAVTALATLYTAVMTFAALRHHRALGTGTYDLGIYDNVLWNTAHGRFLETTVLPAGSHLAGHFDPALALLAPVYRLAPGAETLLVLQVVWLALGVVPLFLLANAVLRRPWAAVAVCAAYLLHPALHGANLFDFHSLTLAIPLLLTALWLLHERRLGSYAAVVALLLLVREDVALLLCGVGFWLVLERRPREGLATLGASLAYFALVRVLVLQSGVLNEGGEAGSQSFLYYYEALVPQPAEGSPGVLVSLLVNPAFVLAHVFSDDKIFYLAVLFVPLLLLPFLGGRGVWLLAFGLASTLLASKGAMFSPYFQYVTLLLPFALALVPAGLLRAEELGVRWLGLDRERLSRALVAALVTVSVLVTVDYGGLVGNGSFRAGSRGLRRSFRPEVAQRFRALQADIAQVGPEASISATRYVVPHVTARDRVAEFPRPAGADFLLLQTDDLDAGQKRHLERLQRSGAYRQLHARGGIELWERVPGVPLP